MATCSVNPEYIYTNTPPWVFFILLGKPNQTWTWKCCCIQKHSVDLLHNTTNTVDQNVAIVKEKARKSQRGEGETVM